MPWYKIDISYGPGHQSQDTTYQYSGELLSEEEEKELGREAVYDNPYARDSDNSVHWNCERVEKLPEKERLERIKHCERSIESANRMLKILKDEA